MQAAKENALSAKMVEVVLDLTEREVAMIIVLAELGGCLMASDMITALAVMEMLDKKGDPKLARTALNKLQAAMSAGREAAGHASA